MVKIMKDGDIFVVPDVGTCKICGEHLEITMKGYDRTFSEYDFLSIASQTESKEHFKAMIKFLDTFVPVCNETYFELRLNVCFLKAIERVKDKEYKNYGSMKTYLMLDEHTNLVKIGRAFNPRKRETTLQSEKPSIRLLKISDSQIETLLHKRYCDKRKRGEWFALSADDIRDICNEFNFYDSEPS